VVLHVPKCLRPAPGFTIVELVAVILILGILAAIVTPRFFGRDVFENRGFHDQVMAALRFAQKAAIAQHQFVCVNFPDSRTVTLTTGPSNACGTPLSDPAGNAAYMVSSSQSAFASLPAAFSFDCLGRPRDVAGAASCSNAAGILATNQTLQVQNSNAIVVEQETGYVHSP